MLYTSDIFLYLKEYVHFPTTNVNTRATEYEFKYPPGERKRFKSNWKQKNNPYRRLMNRNHIRHPKLPKTTFLHDLHPTLLCLLSPCCRGAETYDYRSSDSKDENLPIIGMLFKISHRTICVNQLTLVRAKYFQLGGIAKTTTKLDQFHNPLKTKTLSNLEKQFRIPRDKPFCSS